MNSLVDYHITMKGAKLPPVTGLYDYVLATDGVYIRGKKPGLEVCFPIATCHVRGLVEIEPAFNWDYPLVSEEVVRALMIHAEESAAQQLEQLFHLCWDGETFRLEIPAQDQQPASCRALDDGPESSQARALIEIHSHNSMRAFFSSQDNRDEQGFRIYGVVGRVLTEPEIRVRVGLHGYHWQIPAEWVLELPDGLRDCE